MHAWMIKIDIYKKKEKKKKIENHSTTEINNL